MTGPPVSATDSQDAQWMRLALEQARLARDAGEVPVGAVVVKDGQVVGAGYNRPRGLHDPSAHAEVMALRQAASHLGNYRLDDCTLYVTLEPCAMCAGAIQLGRLRRVVFGPRDPKFGACGSVLNVVEMPRLNHQVEVTEGVLEDESRFALRQFFRRLRQEGRETSAGDPFDPSG